MRSLAAETVRPLTAKFSSDRSELTFAVYKWSQALGFGERMSAPVITARDLLVVLAAGCERRLSQDGPAPSYSGLSWTTDPDVCRMRWPWSDQAFYDVSHQTEIKCE